MKPAVLMLLLTAWLWCGGEILAGGKRRFCRPVCQPTCQPVCPPIGTVAPSCGLPPAICATPPTGSAVKSSDVISLDYIYYSMGNMYFWYGHHCFSMQPTGVFTTYGGPAGNCDTCVQWFNQGFPPPGYEFCIPVGQPWSAASGARANQRPGYEELRHKGYGKLPLDPYHHQPVARSKIPPLQPGHCASMVESSYGRVRTPASDLYVHLQVVRVRPPNPTLPTADFAHGLQVQPEPGQPLDFDVDFSTVHKLSDRAFTMQHKGSAAGAVEHQYEVLVHHKTALP
uniref:Uncharacterized protein n=1 Tax=Schlesneria paludicola TaxID=360056 RepID=A0A7C4LKH3_9PLAN